MADLNDFDYTTDASYDERLIQIETAVAWLHKTQIEQRDTIESLTQSVTQLRTWLSKTLGRLGVETPIDYGGDLRVLS